MSTNSTISSGKQNASLWMLLGVLGVLAAGYFYALPQVTRLKEVRTITEARAADLVALEQQLQEIAATSQVLNSRAADLDRLSLAVPSTAAMEELVVSLEAMASTAGVVLTAVQPTTNAGATGSEAAVTLRGSYSGVVIFLDLLAKNLRPVTITELSLAGSSDVAGASLIDATFTVVAADAIARQGAGAGAVSGGVND